MKYNSKYVKIDISLFTIIVCIVFIKAINDNQQNPNFIFIAFFAMAIYMKLVEIAGYLENKSDK